MFYSIAASISATIGFFLAIKVIQQDKKAPLNKAIFVTILISTTFTFLYGILVDSNGEMIVTLLIKICSTINIIFLLGTMICLFLYARASWYWIVIFFLLHLVYDIAVLNAVWQNEWIIESFKSSVNGNVLILNDNQFWLHADRLRGVFDGIIGLVLLIVTYKKTSSRKNRQIIIVIVIMIILITFLTSLLKAYVWFQWGYPDYSPLLVIFVYLFYFELIRNYRHFQENQPDLQEQLLTTLNRGFLYVNGQGFITKKSRLISEIFGDRKILNRPLIEIFDDREELLGKWYQLLKGEVKDVSSNFYIDDILYNIKISICVDRFSDVEGYLVYFKLLSLLQIFSQKFKLSTREKEVLQCMIDSDDNETIAQLLFISTATVKNHLHNIYKKTGARNRSDILKQLLSEHTQ